MYDQTAQINNLHSEVYPREPCIPGTHQKKRDTERARDGERGGEYVSDTEKRSEPITHTLTHTNRWRDLCSSSRGSSSVVWDRGDCCCLAELGPVPSDGEQKDAA